MNDVILSKGSGRGLDQVCGEPELAPSATPLGLAARWLLILTKVSGFEPGDSAKAFAAEYASRPSSTSPTALHSA